MRALRGRRRDVRFVRSRPLLGPRSGRYAAGAAVVADLIDRDVVDDGLVVGIVNIRCAHVVDGGVIGIVASFPTSTHKANAHVSEPVVDATVVSDMRAPIAGMEAVDASAECPNYDAPSQPA